MINSQKIINKILSDKHSKNKEEYEKILRDMNKNYKTAIDKNDISGANWWSKQIMQHKKGKHLWEEK
jgi:hypothetical protein